MIMKLLSSFPWHELRSGVLALAIVAACFGLDRAQYVRDALAQPLPPAANASSTSNAIIGIICNATIYPDACSRSISQSSGPTPVARPNTGAHTLVSIALKAASALVKESHSIAKACSSFSAAGEQPPHSSAATSLTHLELQAIQDCIALMDIAADQLDLVIANLSAIVAPDGISTSRRQAPALLDLQAWLSGALSLQSTCSDGVAVSGPPVDPDRAEPLARGSGSYHHHGCRARILKAQAQVSEVLTNSLDLVKKLASHGDKLSNWPKHPRSLARREPRQGTGAAGRGGRRANLEYGGGGNIAAHELLNGAVPASSKPRHASANAGDIDQYTARIRGDRLGFPDWVSRSQQRILRRLATGPAALGLVPDVVVAKDGSANFSTVTDALASVDPGKYLPAGRRFVVYIKRGLYNETFELGKSLANVTFVGDGINATVISGSNNVGGGNYTTFRSATVGISAVGFWAIDLTFRNTAGPQGYQAVALRALADLAVFYRCGFEGYQDTLYALANRQFYRGCRIYGTVDFVFGNAIACFQSCELVCRRPMRGQQNTVTAQGRSTGVDISGYSFQNCSVVADAELASAGFAVDSFLGRPWRAYSRTVFMSSFLDSIVNPAGWLSWNSSDPYLTTLYYAEYCNSGPGSATGGRVAWPGVHPALNYTDALSFGAENFILGSTWLPLHVTPYTPVLDRCA